jgi:hypothetical protein
MHEAHAEVDLSAESADAQARPVRRRRLVVIAVVGVLAIGAFLLWGPIGLGNGPLTGAIYATVGGPDATGTPMGFIIPIRNSGQAPAVIDGIVLIGGTKYPAPHVLALSVLTSGTCGGPWPTRHTARGFVLAGCGGKDAGPLIGHAFGPTPANVFGFPAAAEVAAPPPGTCWVTTKIVVHYHVGIRHYSATGPFQFAVCTHEAEVKAAITAAETGS